MDSPLDFLPMMPGIRKPKNKSERIERAKKELARALLETGHTYREVAEALDISVSSVHKISKEPPEKIFPLAEEIGARFAAKHVLLAEHILNRITDYSIVNASLKDRVICAAILTDKAMQMGFRIKAEAPAKAETGAGVFEEREQKNPDNLP